MAFGERGGAGGRACIPEQFVTDPASPLVTQACPRTTRRPFPHFDRRNKELACIDENKTEAEACGNNAPFLREEGVPNFCCRRNV